METSINHFSLVNGIEGSIASKTINFEQCISLAYSLKTILSHIRTFKVVDHHGNPLSSQIQTFKSIFEDLMNTKPKNNEITMKKKRSLTNESPKDSKKKKK